MPIQVVIEPSGLIIHHVTGTMEREETDSVKREMYRHMQAHGRCPVMIHLEAGFVNLSTLASWEDIDEDEYIKQHIERLAIVGDLRWRDSALVFFFNSMVPFQMEYFPLAQFDLAHAWLTH